ncbi:MAG: hypothetical protein CM1200mP40_21820 [Gammaproteobacteria bacterium]|nr:MAG: hypothetical protein CM1200mP40_21820 [Gammaproteobacteria bacterium]
MKEQYGDIKVTQLPRFVVQCEIDRPPNNFFDLALIRDMADCFDELDEDSNCRAIVLCSNGKHFCAGANFSTPDSKAEGDVLVAESADQRNPIYQEAVRLFGNKKPVIAAVQGAAVGGGLGVAMMADFRVVCENTRLTANFVKLGFTPGFGLTHTLPRAIGVQKSHLLFYSGRRINGETAMEFGGLRMFYVQLLVFAKMQSHWRPKSQKTHHFGFAFAARTIKTWNSGSGASGNGYRRP